MNKENLQNQTEDHNQLENKTTDIKFNKKESYSLAPKNLSEAMDFAKMLASSTFVPDNYKRKPGDIVAAMQFGHEVGLGPMQSLKNIAVINGNPCIWGDAMLALVQSHPAFEYIKEEDDGETATCIIKRKGDPEHIVKFSMEDAKNAGLLARKGTWQTYPKRMRQMRARGFALRDKFADALNGLITREEAQDYNVSLETHQKKSGSTKIIHKALTDEQLNKIIYLLQALEVSKENINIWTKQLDIEDFSELSYIQAEECIEKLQKRLIKKENEE